MTQAQINAFQASANTSPANLTLVIASVAALVFLLWGTWIAYSQLRMWRNGQASMYDLVVNIIRAAALMMLLGFIIR